MSGSGDAFEHAPVSLVILQPQQLETAIDYFSGSFQQGWSCFPNHLERQP